MVPPAQAATRVAVDEDETRKATVSGTEVAIREVDSLTPSPEATISPVLPQPIAPEPAEASWYGPGFYGNRTASGEVLRRGTLTAAHRSLPFGTRVRVTNLWNGRTAVVRINDRGPFHGDRVIDLAHGAASELGVTSSGVAKVKLEVLR
jgi:rare lipoprotein A